MASRIAYSTLFAAACVLMCCVHQMAAQITNRNICPAAGLYFDPLDCSRFYECTEGNTVPFPKRCGTGTLYNQFTRQCDWPANVNCNRVIRPVILTNPLPAVIQPLPSRQEVTVSITNPYWPGLNINTVNCASIASALSTTLRNQVARYGCNQQCQNAMPTFTLICNA